MNGLKTLRERRLVTQKELAKAAGVSVPTISRLETESVRPSIRTIRALAKALDMNPEQVRDLLLSKQQQLML